MRLMSLLAVVFVLAGCASTSLPYTPERQPSGARVAAAYQMVGDELRIEVETSGRRVEEAVLLQGDGAPLRPQHMRVTPKTMGGAPISIGVGAGTFGSGVGTGVSVSTPVGGGPTTTDGNTVVSFASAQAGPPPWRLQVKLTGVEPVLIVVGTAPGGSK